MEGATLVRNLRNLPGTVAKTWNALVALHPAAGLRRVGAGADPNSLGAAPGFRRYLILASSRGNLCAFHLASAYNEHATAASRCLLVQPAIAFADAL
jgi:hypothetical protein